jgi:ketosteroid isomerase-like protein
MEASEEVRDGFLRFCDAVKANDVGSFDDVVSEDDATLVIGTAPGERITDRDRLKFGFRTEGYWIEPSAPVAYAEGGMGWVADDVNLHFPDGTEVATRVTAVLVKEDGAWRLVHAHFSVGVPDEEVADLQERWGEG